MFAIVSLAGKQFVAEVGKKIKIDTKLESKDKKVLLSEVLLISDEKKLELGKPVIFGASVDAEVTEEKKAEKVLVMKHHPKKRYRRTMGHRQDQTTLKILKINQK
ncbi:MAG: 50S ribosomal protein L21 [Candidatus Berkelbacteria bacterium]|nr:50S ribosomal protein L21 [Candidatus Berkelbacteria bacterium]